MQNRHRHGARILAYHLVELGVLAAAFFAAYWVRLVTGDLWGDRAFDFDRVVWLLPVSLAVWSVLLWGSNAYAHFRSSGILHHGTRVGVLTLVVTLILFAGVAMLKDVMTNRSFLGLYGLSAFGFLVACRVTAGAFLSYYTQKGYDRHYVLIGGTGRGAVALGRELEATRGAVYQVRGLVTQDPGEVGREIGGWKVLGRYEDVPELASREAVDEVYLLPTRGDVREHTALVGQLETMGIDVHLQMTPFEDIVTRPEVHEVGTVRFLSFRRIHYGVVALFVKRGLDFLGALLMLTVLSPLMLIVSILIRLTSRGPVIFRQVRAGMNGRVFTLLKFRTMREGAEEQQRALEDRNEMSGPVFKMKDDPRVTRLGRLLRRTSIDELPQLWNVLKGDMTLVGPRPLESQEARQITGFGRRRMEVTPGLTCIWQVEGKSRVSFVEWMRMDVRYLAGRRFLRDLKLIGRTAVSMLLHRASV